MGVCRCEAQVWITLGINWKPDSSAKTMRAPNRAAFFYRWPVFLFPACNGFFIPLQGPPFWLPGTPFQTVHQTADMIAVMLNSILTLDQFDNASGGPQIGSIAVRQRSLQKQMTRPFVGLGSASKGDRKSTVPAKPFRLHFARIHRR